MDRSAIWEGARQEFQDVIDLIPFETNDVELLTLRALGKRLISMGEEMVGYDEFLAKPHDKASYAVTTLQFTQMFEVYVVMASLLHASDKLPGLKNLFSDN